MRGGHSTSFDAENDFFLNSHILAEPRKELKSKMRLKTASTHEEATQGEMERHEYRWNNLAIVYLIVFTFSAVFKCVRKSLCSKNFLIKSISTIISTIQKVLKKEFKVLANS